MNEKEIKIIFTRAFDDLIRDHEHLFRINVNERTIAGRLAQSLQPMFPQHDVEVEYNRRGMAPDLLKILDLPERCRGAPNMGIAPDIIVHLPGHDDENLLAVEIKKTTNNGNRECDQIRLAAMRAQLSYRAAAFVEFATGRHFGTRENTLEWI